LNLYNRFRNRLSAYPKMLWLLAIGAFLNVGGLSFLWPLNSIYIHDVLGRPMTVAGIVLLLHSAGASIGFLSGGILFDRFGARPVLLYGMIAAAAIVALPGLTDNWPLYIAVMFLFGLFASMVFPAINALAGKCWPEGGRRAFNFIYVANNIGVAVGTALGGLVAQHSFRLAFFSASLTFLLFAGFVFFNIRDREQPAMPATGSANGESAATQELAATSELPELKIPWLPIGALFGGFLILWIVYVQWQSSISVFIQSEGIPLSSYSLLWTINGVLIFCGQPLISWLVRIFRTSSAQLFLGTALYVIAYSLILLKPVFPIFICAMIVTTFGEMLLWPAIPSAVAQLSPPSRAGFLQGFIGSAATIGRMLGPLTGGLLYDHTTFSTLLAVMIGLLFIPTLAFLLYQKTSGSAR
jgi:predicted MFS family arabinose efflux permease